MRSVEDALVELLELVEVPDDVRTLGDRLSRLLEERDAHYDLTDGRPHDCAACLAKPDRASKRNRSTAICHAARACEFSY